MEQALGLIAASLTTAAFLPQVLKVWKSKSCEDLSYLTFGLLFVGVSLWLVYGLLRNDLPVIVSNAVTVVLAGAVIVGMMKYKPRKSGKKEAQAAH